MVINMVQKVLGITKVLGVNYYDANSQSFGDSLRKKKGLSFQNILDNQIKRQAEPKEEKQSDAYKLDLMKLNFMNMPRF